MASRIDEEKGSLARRPSQAPLRREFGGTATHHHLTRILSTGDGGAIALKDPHPRGRTISISVPKEQDAADAEPLESSSSRSAFLVTWDGKDDPENPRNLSKWRKWAIVLIVASVALCSYVNPFVTKSVSANLISLVSSTFTSSVYTSTYGQLETEFNVSQEVVILGLSLYIFGLGTGPMIMSPMSEFWGRRPIYLVSWAGFVIWTIPCAVARNISTMLVSRFMSGITASAFMSVAGGTIGDLFHGEELGFPMMIYSASTFGGPSLGPLVGGFINQNTSWRWTFYILLIWSGIAYIAVVLFVPETYAPALLEKKTARLRKETRDERYCASCHKPQMSIVRTIAHSCLAPIQLLTLEPMCILLCTFSAVLLGILYLFFEAFPLVFRTNHGFSLQDIGMTFLGLFVGTLVAISTDPFWHRLYSRLAANSATSPPPPELRLLPAMAGGILVPVGIFWFAWTTYPSVHWIVPIIGSGVFGAGMLLSFSGVWTFLVDTYPHYAASALAANSFMRSSFAAGFPLFATQMYNRLGYQWASSLLGFIVHPASVLVLPVWKRAES